MAMSSGIRPASSAAVAEAVRSASAPTNFPAASAAGQGGVGQDGAGQNGGWPALLAEVAHQRSIGREIVVVQGLGFVGAAVAAVIAAARENDTTPRFFVIGVEVPTEGGQAKVQSIQAGRTPINSPDPELDRLTADGATQTRNLTATTDDRAYGLADVILMDVGLDVTERSQNDASRIAIGQAPFEAAVRTIGRHMRPETLVIVESTVPIGATRHIVQSLLDEERRRRGISVPLSLAHAYERVMPGPRYVDSIRRFFRVYSGIDAASADRAGDFLSRFVDTGNFPLTELADPESSEMAKLLENSYRAVNIAFIHEWTLLAEKSGIDLFAVVDAIRRRQGTHDNMRLPGFGVGGYCLTKDSLLAQWSANRFFGNDLRLGLSLEALRINDAMPLHSLDLVREILGGSIAGRTVAILGVAYLPDVADTRSSPTAILAKAVEDEGGHVLLHDPVVERWAEHPDRPIARALDNVLGRADAVVLAVAHAAYRQLSAKNLLALSAPSAVFVDANNILSDEIASGLRAAGRRLIGVGKGHWRRREYHRDA